MKKSGIIALIVGGAALIGAGIIKVMSKPEEEYPLDVETDEVNDRDYETEESED